MNVHINETGKEPEAVEIDYRVRRRQIIRGLEEASNTTAMNEQVGLLGCSIWQNYAGIPQED
jgi:hypothetical protein